MTEPCNYHKPHQSLFNEAKYYLLVVRTTILQCLSQWN